MVTGIILIVVAWVIFVILGFIGRFASDGRHRKDVFDFEIGDLLDDHLTYWFWDDAKQIAYRAALALSFCLYAAGVIVFTLNLGCLADFYVIVKLLVAFLGGVIAGWILIGLANIIVIGVPMLGIAIAMLPLMFLDWLRGK